MSDADVLYISVPDEHETDNPFLQGPFRAQRNELDATHEELTILGEVPEDLFGMYVRNTHNQAQAPLGIYHPFDGDGMLHAIRFEGGKVEYRNRFVRTTGFHAEQGAKKSLWPGLLQPGEYQRRGWGSMGVMKDNAGTDVNAHAGKLIASMSQGSEPWALSPHTLETHGAHEWGRLVPDGLSSHYKVDHATGDMIFFNYPEKFPYMHYGVVSKANQLVHYVPIELPGARWPHDLGMTKNYSILHDLPYFFDPEMLKQGARKLEFHHDIPSRFGIIPRFGRSEDVRWFETQPCWVMHLTNCYEDGDWVIQDGCIWDNPVMPPVGADVDVYSKISRQLDKHRTHTHMYRWMFNMRTGETREFSLDDEVTEFPVLSSDYNGLKYRYSYNSLFVPNQWLMSGIKRYDLATGDMDRYEYGEGRYGSESCVARAVGATAEDDGYVINFVTDINNNSSECVVLRADDVAAGPICRIILPERISVGTHACWVEGDRIDGENRNPAELEGIQYGDSFVSSGIRPDELPDAVISAAATEQ
ncbi:carotenoid oxygenase family protein [Dietzia cinnamea]|uniref:carotenoid oxygenase family protein n=1 Tax=Dietzia cinnamea TaxID=321318 RepID=UPI0021AE3861|nr:carotenoid oxygenase family protein [Dietzia cinnamea]MCT2062777.1 carotenoid oxygenase family protein [Dietzia cinnamea]MCT2237612.1 carotenoid oxygenase family protein [Dietzia cinnamea]MCT2302419.1 carotenoid oxygenase family protein [Dietzia cinnamea]